MEFEGCKERGWKESPLSFEPLADEDGDGVFCFIPSVVGGAVKMIRSLAQLSCGNLECMES